MILANPNSLFFEKPFFNSGRMASDQRVPVDKQAKFSLQIGPLYFEDSFIILPTMSSVILGELFFKKHNFTIDPSNKLLQLPDLTVQLNQTLPEKGKKRYTKKLPQIPLILTTKVHIAPQSQVLLESSSAKLSDQYQSCTGLVIPKDRLKVKCSFALTSSLSRNDDTSKIFVSAINLSDNQITLNNQTEIAHSEFLNEAQADDRIEIDIHVIGLSKMRNPDEFEGELNQLIQDFYFKNLQTNRSPTSGLLETVVPNSRDL